MINIRSSLKKILLRSSTTCFLAKHKVTIFEIAR